TTGLALADDAGEVIGLALDSHSWEGRSLDDELAAQTELVTDGDFDNPAAWSLDNVELSIAGGKLLATATTGVRNAFQDITLTASSLYRLRGVVDSTNGSFGLQIAN